ncbi:hypothetical protein, partial [Proteus mirabilis]|uniref:hypothetical protein n=1 Tax=Proteus mirabilis TaxID=584 RepID=UPI001C7D8A46
IIFSITVNKHHFKIFSCVLFSLSMLIPFHVFSPYSLIALTIICTQMHLKKNKIAISDIKGLFLIISFREYRVVK